MSLELENSDRRDADSALLRARRRDFPWLLMLSLAAAACDDSASPSTEEDRDPASDEETRDAARPPRDAANGGQTSDAANGGQANDAANGGQASDAGNGGQDSDAASGGDGHGCTRERLAETVDDYFRALAAQDPSQLTVAQNVKFTENGTVYQLGQGTLWTTAGELSFRRNVLDTERCGTLTQGVIDRAGTPTIVGVRLRLEDDAISEVESYLVTGGFFNNPSGVMNDGNARWEEVLPAEARSTREELNAIADSYFELFGDSPPTVPFATECMRYENGQVAPGVMHCSDGVPQGLSITGRRYPIADLEAGIAVGFVLFAGSLDFHMFKVRGGEVVGIHALVASRASSSGWD